MFKNRFNKGVMVAGVSALVAASANMANAAAQDYTGLATAVTTEITAAMPTILTVTGTILAIGVGIKLFKRFAK